MFGSTVCPPPQAILPMGAPAARAAWKIARPVKTAHASSAESWSRAIGNSSSMDCRGRFGAAVAPKIAALSANFGEAERLDVPPQRNVLGSIPVDDYPDPMDVLAAPGAGLL